MNTVICTAQGFVKEIKFNKEARFHEIFFTNKLREARWWNSKTAKSKMERHEIIGWLYNPYAEEPMSDLWGVVPVTREVNWKQIDTGAFTIQKCIAFANSDVRFLQGYEKPTNVYSKEEAIQLAIQKNLDANMDIRRELIELGHSFSLK